MTYYTTRGEFPSLQQIRAAYLDSADGEKFWLDPTPFAQDEWQPNLLHASDLGSCPRSVAYRLLGTPEKPRSAASSANRKVMFWAAYRFHYLCYSALNWAGLLLAHEEEVEMPAGWTGRRDARICENVELPDEQTTFDEKTVMPLLLKNPLRGTLPKESNCLQVASYGGKRGLIEYTDRAGQNTPEECRFTIAEWANKLPAAMQVLERARDLLPELPPMLPQVYVGHYSYQGKLTSITFETDWRCGYCPWHLTRKEKRVNPASGRMKEYGYTCRDSLCKPDNDPPLTVAEWKDGPIKVKSAHEEGVERWLASHVTSVPVYSEED